MEHTFCDDDENDVCGSRSQGTMARSFNADVSQWNTANVISMKAMFHNAHAFNADISKW